MRPFGHRESKKVSKRRRALVLYVQARHARGDKKAVACTDSLSRASACAFLSHPRARHRQRPRLERSQTSAAGQRARGATSPRPPHCPSSRARPPPAASASTAGTIAAVAAAAAAASAAAAAAACAAAWSRRRFTSAAARSPGAGDSQSHVLASPRAYAAPSAAGSRAGTLAEVGAGGGRWHRRSAQ